MAKKPINLTVLGGEMVRPGAATAATTAPSNAAAATTIPYTNPYAGITVPLQADNFARTGPVALDNPGLSRLMAERDAILAQAATNVDRREKLSNAARKGWETRRANAEANATREFHEWRANRLKAVDDGAYAKFSKFAADYEALSKQAAEQRAIWAQQDAALKAKKTLFQRLAVRLLSLLGVR